MFRFRHIALLLVALACHTLAMAQQGSAVRFDSLTADFGHINELDGVVRRSFTAVNEGADSVLIREIVSTCDCTSTHQKAVTLAPRESLTFEVMYDPTNRPGRFERTLYVVVSDSDTPIELMITGRVIPRERTVEEIYPYYMGGGLRLDNTFASFTYIEHGKQYTMQIAYANTSDDELELRFVPNVESGALRIDYPERIAPHTTGDITFSYALPADSRCYGQLDDRVWVEVNGERSRLMVTAYGVAVDNFDEVDDILSPRAVYSKKNIKFGDVNRSSRCLTQPLELKNEGGAMLYVRDVRCDSPAVKCRMRGGKRVAEGRSKIVRVKLNPREVEADGNFVTRLRIVTNDPLTPLQVVRLTAVVK